MEYHKMKIAEINCETGEETIREATNAEKEDAKSRKEQFEAEQAEAEAKAATRAALLTRLGITEEEARILLGGN
jgi:hypothetical protein